MGLGYKKLENGMNKFRCLNGSKNAHELSQEIRITSAHTDRVLSEVFEEDGDWTAIERRTAKPGWDEVSIAHFRAALAYRLGDYALAYTNELDCYNAFLRLFLNMTRWSIPVLFAVSKDLSHVARLADEESRAKGARSANKVEEAIRAINQGFSLCMTDREPSLKLSRKWGTYHMANLLFSLYLRQRAYNLCTSMIRAIKASELPSLDNFPMSDQVTFRFYRGMLAFRSESYASAKGDLQFAIRHCHRSAHENKRRILTYLVPLMMMDGCMPDQSILHSYPAVCDLYGGLIDAVKAGNVGLFDRLLAEKQDRLAALGTFLAVEHARKIAVRQLLYKVYLIDGRISRVSFDRFRRGLEFACGCAIELIEVESILADMIFCGYVKGYLAHSHGLAVLSKQQPFPPLASLATPPTPPPTNTTSVGGR